MIGERQSYSVEITLRRETNLFNGGVLSFLIIMHGMNYHLLGKLIVNEELNRNQVFG